MLQPPDTVNIDTTVEGFDPAPAYRRHVFAWAQVRPHAWAKALRCLPGTACHLSLHNHFPAPHSAAAVRMISAPFCVAVPLAARLPGFGHLELLWAGAVLHRTEDLSSERLTTQPHLLSGRGAFGGLFLFSKQPYPPVRSCCSSWSRFLSGCACGGHRSSCSSGSGSENIGRAGNAARNLDGNPATAVGFNKPHRMCLFVFQVPAAQPLPLPALGALHLLLAGNLGAAVLLRQRDHALGLVSSAAWSKNWQGRSHWAPQSPSATLPFELAAQCMWSVFVLPVTFFLTPYKYHMYRAMAFKYT